MRTAYWKKSLLSLTFGLSLFGCGQQTFNVTESQHNADAPGGVDVPARVDILMVMDNTGSMIGKEAFVAQQIRQQFLGRLDAQTFDYRFAMIPTTPSGGVPALTQVVGSRYSSNHPMYTPPYPQADENDPQIRIDPSLFATSANFYSFPGANQGGAEPAIKTVGDVLNTADWQNRFLRPNAKLVIIPVSNGDDTSDPLGCPPGVYPCNQSSTVSAGLINAIKSVKPSAKIYPIVNVYRTYCLGGTYAPARYESAVSQMGGRTYPLCTADGRFENSFSTVLANLASELPSLRQEYEKEFVVLNQQPILSTLKVYKRKGGTRTLLAQSSTNGWTYIGYGTASEITIPVYSEPKTGWIIHLHGTARAIGSSETIEVDYLPVGSQPST